MSTPHGKIGLCKYHCPAYVSLEMSRTPPHGSELCDAAKYVSNPCNLARSPLLPIYWRRNDINDKFETSIRLWCQDI